MKALEKLVRFPYTILIIVALVLVIYGQILFFTLGKLDEYNIILVNMDLLRDFGNLKEALLTNPFFHKGGEFYRPLQNISFMLDAHLSGESGWGYYLSNLAIHTVTCALIGYLLVLLGTSKKIAILLSLVYSVHPLFVQTVAWVPSRGDMLIALFGTLSFIMFLKYIREGKRRYLVLHIIAYGLALFSKESAVLIPVVCYLYFFLIEKGAAYSKQGLAISWICYISLVGIFFYLRQEVVQISVPDNQIGLLVLLQNLRTIPEFVFKFLIPAGLTPMPAYNWIFTILGGIFVLILSLLMFKAGSGSFRLFVFGSAWFLLFTLPALVYVNKYGSASYDYMEHRAYMPLAGLMLVIGPWLTNRVNLHSHRYVHYVLIVLIVILGFYTSVYARNYQDGTSFFARAVKMNPGSSVAWYCQGTIRIVEHNDHRAAMYDFDRALALYPDYGQAFLNRGYCKELSGDYVGAINDYKSAVKTDPTTYEPHAALALLYDSQNKQYEALEEYDIALTLNPAFSEGYYRRARLRMGLNDYPAALEDLDRFIGMDDVYAPAYLYRGVIRFQFSQYELSMRDFDRAISLDDSLTEAYINRGVLKFQVGDQAGAVADLDRAVGLDGRSADAFLNRGRVLYFLGRQQDAVSDWQKAAILGSREAEFLLRKP